MKGEFLKKKKKKKITFYTHQEFEVYFQQDRQFTCNVKSWRVRVMFIPSRLS